MNVEAIQEDLRNAEDHMIQLKYWFDLCKLRGGVGGTECICDSMLECTLRQERLKAELRGFNNE